jgi:hypothetical protein
MSGLSHQAAENQAALQLGNFASAFAASKTSRFTFFVEQAATLRSLPECKEGHPAYSGRAKRDALLTRVLAREISKLTGFLAVLISSLPAFAGPLPASVDASAIGTPAPIAFVTVSRLGESDKEAALRDGRLLSHRRATDPFGITVRGSFKGLPPVVEQPAPAQPSPTQPPLSQVAAAVNVPTLEKAIQELVIGAVNLGSHQILIGSRSIHEGDLLVLESGGGQFIVWVQSVGVRGVLFCDTELQKHILKPFGFGPKELPMDQIWGVSEISKSLDQDAKQ